MRGRTTVMAAAVVAIVGAGAAGAYTDTAGASAAEAVRGDGVGAGARGMPDRWLTAEQAIEDVRDARRGIEMIHPGLGRYGPASVFSEAMAALERDAAAGMSERALFAGLSTALAGVRCSHTKLEPSEAWAKWRAESATYLPVRFAVEDGRMMVSASMAEGVRAGDEIVAIDGRGAAEVLGRLVGMVPADGFTDGARWYALGGASDLDDCEFDHFYPFVYAQGERVRLEVRGAGEGKTRVVEAAWVTRDARAKALPRAETGDMDESVSLRMVDGVGVLRVGTFVAYRKKITPEEILRPLFERINAEKCTALVLDMRDNGGGSDDAAATLMRLLIERPMTVRTRGLVKAYKFGDLKERLWTWNAAMLEMPDEAFEPEEGGMFAIRQSGEFVLEPLKGGFTGPVVALTGPANASGATMFLAGLKEKRGAVLVGEPTGGAVDGPTAGVIYFMTLKHSGVRVRIPGIRSVTDLGGAGGAGGGLTPDVVVMSRVRERLAGRDPVLEAGIAAAREARSVTR